MNNTTENIEVQILDEESISFKDVLNTIKKYTAYKKSSYIQTFQDTINRINDISVEENDVDKTINTGGLDGSNYAGKFSYKENGVEYFVEKSDNGYVKYIVVDGQKDVSSKENLKTDEGIRLYYSHQFDGDVHLKEDLQSSKIGNAIESASNWVKSKSKKLFDKIAKVDVVTIDFTCLEPDYYERLNKEALKYNLELGVDVDLNKFMASNVKNVKYVNDLSGSENSQLKNAEEKKKAMDLFFQSYAIHISKYAQQKHVEYVDDKEVNENANEFSEKEVNQVANEFSNNEANKTTNDFTKNEGLPLEASEEISLGEEILEKDSQIDNDVNLNPISTEDYLFNDMGDRFTVKDGDTTMLYEKKGYGYTKISEELAMKSSFGSRTISRNEAREAFRRSDEYLSHVNKYPDSYVIPGGDGIAITVYRTSEKFYKTIELCGTISQMDITEYDFYSTIDIEESKKVKDMSDEKTREKIEESSLEI